MVRRGDFRTFLLALALALVAVGPRAAAGAQDPPSSSFCFRAIELAELRGESVEVVREAPGKHGGSLYYVRPRLGHPWEASSGGQTPQGSPLWVFNIFDARTAEFFGFRHEGKLMVIPNQEEFTGALERFNSASKSKDTPLATWGVYIEKDLHAPQERYLLRVATEAKLPWAEKGNHFHHDLNFHVLATLALPTEFLRLAQRQILAFFEFRAFLEKNHPDLYAEPLSQEIVSMSVDELSKNIDFGTGILPQEPLREDWLVRALRVQALFSGGRSPRDFLRDFLPAVMARIHSRDLQRTVERSVRAALREFLASKKRDPQFAEGIPEAANPDWVMAQVRKRVAAVQAEVHRIDAAEGGAKDPSPVR